MNRKEEAMNMNKMVSALLISLAVFSLVGGGFVSAASAADCSNLRCDEGSPSGDGNWDADVTSITVSPSTIRSGERLSVNALIKNTGKNSGTFNILLRVQSPNGDVAVVDETKIMHLSVGGTDEVSLSYTVTGPSGEYCLSVEIVEDPNRSHLFGCGCGSFSVAPTPGITITNPKDGEEITWSEEGYHATGIYSGLPDGFNIHIIARPLTTGQWWVQRGGMVHSDRNWKASVFCGIEDRGAGEDYELYAVMTEEMLEEGLIEKLPDHVAMAMVRVSRIQAVQEVEDGGGDGCTYTLSASPSPETPLVVDDDLEVKVNGETVFIDDDGYATLDGRASWKGDPITFSALPGYELEIIATNPGGGGIELSALYLHAGGESVQLSDGVPNAPGGDLYEFFRERFTISIPASSPSVRIIGRPSSVHGGEDLEVVVGWSNVPEGWKLAASLEKSEIDKDRLADDVEWMISGSGEDVFKLKVYPVNETYNQARVWTCLRDENDNWASVFTSTNITVLPAQQIPITSPKPPTYLLAAAAILFIALIFAARSRKKKRPAPTAAEPAPPPEPTTTEPAPNLTSPSPPEPIPPPIIPADQFTTLRTIWDPSKKDFVWGAGKPDEYGELPRIKRWIEGNNPNIYWFLLKIVNHADHPVTEWNIALYTEQALTITEAHIDEKRVRIVKSDFDTDNNRNVCVVAIPPELGVSIPANGGRRSMYFKIDIRCEDALKMEFGVSGVVKLGKSPQAEVPIREKRFTYACKFGDFENMFRGSPDTLASQVMENLQNPDNREIVQNFTNSFRLIRDFEKYCNDRYAESEILIGKLEMVHSSLKAAEPITKEEILPLVEENLAALRMMSGVEAQKERGIRMCERLVELLHIATSKIK